jgi:hypothetical protein
MKNTEKAVVTRHPGAPPLPEGIDFGTIMKALGLLEKDWTIIQEVLAIWGAVHSMPVGGDQPVPPIKVQLGAEHYTWGSSVIHRDS